jgi:single-strand DNA-binding protein
MSINSAAISGNLVRDAEIRSTGKTSVLRFTVAVNKRRKNSQTGEWEDYPNYLDCVMFGTRADALVNRLTKGTKVSILGEIQQNRWKDKEGKNRSAVEIIANEIEFFSAKKEQQQQTQYDSNIPF